MRKSAAVGSIVIPAGDFAYCSDYLRSLKTTWIEYLVQNVLIYMYPNRTRGRRRLTAGSKESLMTVPIFTHPAFDGHEEVAFCCDPGSGLR
ncbi:MAG TPA: hypothetical protein VLA28_06015, partial [Afifellaceae bacterium]|nr:hypothetical protein [Afifellaceae bacterium]